MAYVMITGTDLKVCISENLAIAILTAPQAHTFLCAEVPVT